MIDKKELFKVFAEDFKKTVIKYRKAGMEEKIEKPYFRLWEDEKQEKYYEEQEKRRNSINTSKDYINLTREEYWKNILKSKIEVFGAIVGFEVMQEFSMYLRNIDIREGEDNVMLESAFCYFADGICGWCR